MTPSQKVVSLETAKKLKAAGYLQETEHEYHKVIWACFSMYNAQLDKSAYTPIEGEKPFIELDFRQEDVNGKDYMYIESWLAPDATEILVSIPSISSFSSNRYWSIFKQGDEWHIYWNKDQANQYFTDANLVEALAACWLWLKEQKLI